MVTFDTECGGAEFAREKGIPVFIFPKRKDAQDGLSVEDLVMALRSDLYFLKVQIFVALVLVV